MEISTCADVLHNRVVVFPLVVLSLLVTGTTDCANSRIPAVVLDIPSLVVQVQNLIKIKTC